MDQTLADLLNLLVPERIERNIFRGQSRDIGTPQVFGGQVLAQALYAASATVKSGIIHSMHAYFLRRGDIDAPIVYQVDISRNGLTFSNRRVVAIQHGKQIFNMTASFQIPEAGLEHQAPMPDVHGPEGLRRIARLIVPRQDLTGTVERMLVELPLLDLTVSDPPIEDVIGRMFEEGGS